MYTTIKHFHSYIAAIALVFIAFAIIYSFFSWSKEKSFVKMNKISALSGLIWAHIQLLIGLVLYFLSPNGFSNFSGVAMKNSLSRLYVLEHPLTMIIAVVLITIGYSKAKSQKEDIQKYKKIFIFYGIGLLLILSRIPWNAWGTNN